MLPAIGWVFGRSEGGSWSTKHGGLMRACLRSTRLLVVVVTMLSWPLAARAAEVPRQLVVPIHCASGGATTTVALSCDALDADGDGWIDARLEWRSGGQAIFVEEGPLLMARAAEGGAV